VNPGTLDKLRSLPNGQNPKPVWPQGKRQPLTKAVAERFFALVATNDRSLMSLLHDHPDLPPFMQLNNWRRRNPWFNEAWNEANKLRALFLAEKVVDLQNDANPKTAHVVRVRFDIIKWLCAKLHPEAYSDNRPAQQQTTNVQIGVSISPERLTEIRTKLDSTRTALKPRSNHASQSSSLSLTHSNGELRTKSSVYPKRDVSPIRDVTPDSERVP
jgi:hypothetical protein